jgi:hypothetical protein
MQEEQVASIIASVYCCNLDEDIISHAIKKQKMSFIRNMFVYNKNYQTIYPKKLDAFELALLGKKREEAEREQAKGPTYKVFTQDFVMKKLIDFLPYKAEECIFQMASWMLKSTENVIRSILNNSMDLVANKFALKYIHNCDDDLLIFAVSNQNE